MDTSIKIYVIKDKKGLRAIKTDLPPIYDEHEQRFYENNDCGVYEWLETDDLDYMDIKYNKDVKLGKYERVK